MMVRMIFGLLLLVGFVVLAGFVWMQAQKKPQQEQPEVKTAQPDARMQEIRTRATGQLQWMFDQANVPYPPKRMVLVGFKDSKQLECYVESMSDVQNNGTGQPKPLQHVKTWPIFRASGQLGPKRREGDRQVPEGIYEIEALNPNSRFHLSLKVNYPNAFDLARASEDGRDEPGSWIMIHGGNASTGCLAMGDRTIEEIYTLAEKIGIENIELWLCPVDFRVRDLPATMPVIPEWMPAIYDELRDKLSTLPAASKNQ